MKLSNAARAIVDIKKLRDYCLSESHPRGKHKARVFESALGLTAIDVSDLRDAILSAIQTEEVVTGERDEYGQRYIVDFSMKQKVKLLDVVALTQELPERDLPLGQVGTVVELLAPDVYEVEFSDNDGRAFAELALRADQLLVLHYEPVMV